MAFIKKRILLCFIFLLLINFSFELSVISSNNLKKNSMIINNEQLSPHLPIYIKGNNNFTFFNGVVSGDGSKNNPFIIKNWDIKANLSNDGIRIENTNKFFIIKDCNIHFLDGIIAMHSNPDNKTPYFKNEEEKPFPIGIFLNNVTNGIIKKCEIIGTYKAVCFNNSYSNTITDCYFFRNLCGIGIKLNSYDNTVLNSCSRNYNCGVCLYQNASYNLVDNCTSSALHSIFAPLVLWTGYHIESSKFNTVRNCSSYLSGSRFFKILDRGFIIKHSYNNSVKNYLSHGLPSALVINSSSNNSVTNSDIYNNFIGFRIDCKSRDNCFKKNCFIKNIINAFDFSKNNFWDNNYWDDWIGLKFRIMKNKPYNIPGRLFYNYDFHPKFFPD
jgi:hypothetical protein